MSATAPLGWAASGAFAAGADAGVGGDPPQPLSNAAKVKSTRNTRANFYIIFIIC